MSSSADWQIYRTRFLVKARQLDAPLVFTDALGREHHGIPGDYLVESGDGLQRIAPREIFEDIYVPMGLAGDSWPLPLDARHSRARIDLHSTVDPSATPSGTPVSQSTLPTPSHSPLAPSDHLPQHPVQPHYQLHQQQQVYEPCAASAAAAAGNRQPQLNPRRNSTNRSFVA